MEAEVAFVKTHRREERRWDGSDASMVVEKEVVTEGGGGWESAAAGRDRAQAVGR